MTDYCKQDFTENASTVYLFCVKDNLHKRPQYSGYSVILRFVSVESGSETSVKLATLSVNTIL